MKRYLSADPVSFDDILLVPQGGIESRSKVDFKMQFGNWKLDLPIISSPMTTVTEESMARAMYDEGGLGVLHRFMPLDKQIAKLKTLPVYARFPSIGIKEGWSDDLDLLVNECDIAFVCIDVANGHDKRVADAVKAIKQWYPHIHVMAGNVATYYGYQTLAAAGADSVRVGIGGGSVCTTRIVSGHGVPTLASLLDIADGKSAACAIVADGGIRTTGDMVKAFAAGADAVMLGRMLAGTFEASNYIFGEDYGHKYKLYSGQASEYFTDKVEGTSVKIPMDNAPTVKEVVNKMKDGIASGCSYSGVDRLADLTDAARYVRVSSNGLAESRPHALES